MVLIVGIAIGVLSSRLAAIGTEPAPVPSTAPVAEVTPPPPQSDIRAVTPHAAPAEANAPAPEAALRVETDAPAGDNEADALAVVTRTLRARLESETVARRRLASEVEQLRTTLAAIGRDVEALTSRQADRDRRGTRQRRRQTVSADTLVDAGYPESEAVRLAERWGEQAMSELYLEDQARREGWMDTDRYQEALADVRRGPESLRGSLGDEDYDAFLYSIGRSNRLIVDSVFESSPAQAAGLLPGDTIRGYDGTRVFSWNDLRSGIGAGEPDFPVTMEIERDGEVYAIEIDIPPLDDDRRQLDATRGGGNERETRHKTADHDPVFESVTVNRLVGVNTQPVITTNK